MINSDIYNLMIECKNQKEIIVPTYDGKQGNPVLFAKSLKDKIMTIEGDNGAKKILEQNKNRIFNIEIKNQSILKDFNTLESFDFL